MHGTMTKPHYHPFKLQQDVLDNLDAIVKWLKAHPQFRPARRGRSGVSRADALRLAAQVVAGLARDGTLQDHVEAPGQADQV